MRQSSLHVFQADPHPSLLFILNQKVITSAPPGRWSALMWWGHRQTGPTYIQYRNLFPCTSAEISPIVRGQARDDECDRQFWMSMNTFVIEQKQGQVKFHGDLQHKDREIKDDIYSPMPLRRGAQDERHVEDAEGTDWFSRDNYDVLNMERNTIPSPGLRQEIWQGVTLHLMANLNFHTRATDVISLSQFKVTNGKTKLAIIETDRINNIRSTLIAHPQPKTQDRRIRSSPCTPCVSLHCLCYLFLGQQRN